MGRKLTRDEINRRQAKAIVTAQRKGWDAYAWWQANPEKRFRPRNPYGMSMARNDWARGFQMAEKGLPRPEYKEAK